MAISNLLPDTQVELKKALEQREKFEAQVLDLENGPTDPIDFVGPPGIGPSKETIAANNRLKQEELNGLKLSLSKVNQHIARIQRIGKIERTIFPNELEEFNSVNHLFGLYCLTTDEILDPDAT